MLATKPLHGYTHTLPHTRINRCAAWTRICLWSGGALSATLFSSRGYATWSSWVEFRLNPGPLVECTTQFQFTSFGVPINRPLVLTKVLALYMREQARPLWVNEQGEGKSFWKRNSKYMIILQVNILCTCSPTYAYTKPQLPSRAYITTHTNSTAHL